MMQIMSQRRILIFIFSALVLAGFVTFTLRGRDFKAPMNDQTSTQKPFVVINGIPVEVLIADTPDERRRGLSGRGELLANQGMLFVFDKSDAYNIWMKDMQFSIDVIWISSGGVVVDIRKDISPETYPEVFGPRTSAQYVLEVPAGFAEKYDISVGDRTVL
jgi:hypothetical protein